MRKFVLRVAVDEDEVDGGLGMMNIRKIWN